MPYENEHSARLLDPNKTPHDRVTRTHGSGDGNVQGVKIPTSIDIIWFIEEQEGKDDIVRAQALRFPIKNWTSEKALKWLKDHKIKYMDFEAAKKKEEKKFLDGNKSETRCIDPDFALEYREDNKSVDKIIGKGIVFDKESLDLGGFIEIIKPESVREIDWTDTMSLYNHDLNQILGRYPNTMSIDVSNESVRYTITAAGSTYTKDLIIHIERKDVKGSSFTFHIARDGDDWHRRPDGIYIRTIYKFKEIRDLSPVVHPAYPDTTVAKRSLDLFMTDETIPKGIRTDIARKRIEFLNMKH